MVMRQQRGGAAGSRPRAPALRPVFEQFKPLAERLHVGDSEILHIHLPGFAKEQIKVSTESNQVLRVRGDRLVEGNKWSRFQEDFIIPQGCVMGGIRAKFEGGILTITMPINSTTTPSTQLESPKTQETKTTQQNPPIPKKPLEASEPKPSIVQDTSPPKVVSTSEAQKQTEPKVTTQEPLSPRMEVPQPKKDSIVDGTQSKMPEIEKNEHGISKDGKTQIGKAKEAIEKAVTEQKGDKDGDNLEPKMSKNFMEKGEEKEKKSIEERKESRIGDGKEQKAKEEDKGGCKMEKYKKGLSEDRHLMVNVGVAVLVIVALGAYISYT